MSLRRRLPALVACTALLAGCSSRTAAPGEPTTPSADPAASSGAATGTEQGAVASSSEPVVTEPVEQALDAALSEPVEDSVYPAVGDPRVDALHYDLDLSWDPDARRLEASAIVSFRAARTAPRFQLDLGPELTVGRLELDGEGVNFARRGKDLVVRAPIEVDERYELTLD